MILVRFDDRVYARTEQGLLVWEPSWETFRPVVSIVWNPTHSRVEPYYGDLVQDVFDAHYGYGTDAVKEACIAFTDENAFDIEAATELKTPTELWTWAKTIPLSWAADRPVAVLPSAPFDRKQYLARYAMRAKTCRRAPRNLRGTRKVVTH